jgi:hypothetical protein
LELELATEDGGVESDGAGVKAFGATVVGLAEEEVEAGVFSAGFNASAGVWFAAIVPFTFIWSLTLRTPGVPLAIFMAWSSTSGLGTSPERVTTPSLTATFTLACLVVESA